MTEPWLTTSGWSWVNQGSAAVSVSRNGAIVLTEPGRGMGTNFRCYVRSLPSAPYTVTVQIDASPWAKSYIGGGLLWRESGSGKCIFATQTYNGGYHLDLAKFTDPSTPSASYQIIDLAENLHWIRLRDDTTNRILETSIDGEDWHTFHSVGRTDFLTADQWGIFVTAENASAPNFDATISLKGMRVLA
jgi:hypothetical protein